MKLINRISQHRRDFRGTYECEHCGYSYVGQGYDDANFHYNVIPSMKCQKCGEAGTGPSSDPIVPAGVVL